MTNPDARERLEACGQPRIVPWKTLERAVRALYEDDETACAAAATALSGPPEVLRPLFRAWLEGGREATLPARTGAASARLHDALFSAPHPTALLADQAEEALRQGMEEHFEALALRVIRGLHDAGRAEGGALALRYTLRCLKLLDDSGLSRGNFLAAATRVLGQADGLVAQALATLESDEAGAGAALAAAIGVPPGASGTYDLVAPGHEPDEGRFLSGELRGVALAAIELLSGGSGTSTPEGGAKEKIGAAPCLAGRGTPDSCGGQLELFSAEAFP